MIYTVTLNPALDKTVEIPGVTLNAVNRITAVRTDPGGKGINVSKVIQKLGGESVAMALLAGKCGQQIADACTDLGLVCDFTYTAGETRTNLKIMDTAAYTNTDLNEPGLQVPGAVLDGLLARLSGSLQRGDVVVLAGSLPKGASPELYREWTTACRARGAKVFLDADGANLARAIEAGPYLVKPNSRELSELVGRDLVSIEDTAAAGRSLLKGATEKVIVSLGEEGALFLTAEGSLWAHGLAVEVGSTVGAGDAMVAALALSEARGAGMEETIRLAVAASAANAMCRGSQAAERETVLTLMPQVVYERLDTANKTVIRGE